MAKTKKTEAKAEEVVETTAPPAEETTNPEAQQAIEQLTVNDLIVIKNVFDVCSQRGAFKADEMQTVGGVYNKLNNFLQAVVPQPAEPETAETPAAEEETQGES